MLRDEDINPFRRPTRAGDVALFVEMILSAVIGAGTVLAFALAISPFLFR